MWINLTFDDQYPYIKKGVAPESSGEIETNSCNFLDFSFGTAFVIENKLTVGGAVYHINEPNDGLRIRNHRVWDADMCSMSIIFRTWSPVPDFGAVETSPGTYFFGSGSYQQQSVEMDGASKTRTYRLAALSVGALTNPVLFGVSDKYDFTSSEGNLNVLSFMLGPTTKGCRLTTSLTSTPQRRTTAVGRTSFRSSMWCLLSITVILALSFIGKLRFPCRNFNQYKKAVLMRSLLSESLLGLCRLSCFLTVVVQGYAEKFVPFSINLYLCSNMNIWDENIEQYLLDHIEPEPEFLKQLTQKTHLYTLKPRMLSGHLEGRLLKFFCLMANARNVLEIGTFTGYSRSLHGRGIAA